MANVTMESHPPLILSSIQVFCSLQGEYNLSSATTVNSKNNIDLNLLHAYDAQS